MEKHYGNVKFQSLFFWILPTGIARNNMIADDIVFQSLFFWILPTGRLCIFWIYSIPEVSILVLLDTAYRPESALVSASYNLCFNPCSSGYCLPAKSGTFTVKGNLCFNPCSSGYCLPARFSGPAKYGVYLFQSLFFWILPTGLNSTVAPLAERRFNPCSSGYCLPAVLELDMLERKRKFQSLFFWILPTGRSWSYAPSVASSFNPCSSGYCLPAT